MWLLFSVQVFYAEKYESKCPSRNSDFWGLVAWIFVRIYPLIFFLQVETCVISYFLNNAINIA